MRARGLLAGLGVLLGLYGAWLLMSRQDPGQLLEAGLWLAGGVLAHDVVLTALLVALGLAGSRLLTPAWRAPATVALVVWGTLTVVAVPVLGRFGARPDNATLLDRPYLLSWSLLTVLTVATVVVAGLVRSRRPTPAPDRG
jgi:hypothetical protein